MSVLTILSIHILATTRYIYHCEISLTNIENQWPFQEPKLEVSKLEVPARYKVDLRAKFQRIYRYTPQNMAKNMVQCLQFT